MSVVGSVRCPRRRHCLSACLPVPARPPACLCLQQLAFVKSLERRIDGARFTLNRQLQSALAAALSARAWGAAGHCLRGFLELAEAGHAEEGLRQHLLGPLVRQVVTDVRQQQLQGGQAAGSSPLSQVVALSLSRLREDAGPLLAQLTAPGSGLGGIDLLGAVLLTELSTAVADGLPGERAFTQRECICARTVSTVSRRTCCLLPSARMKTLGSRVAPRTATEVGGRAML